VKTMFLALGLVALSTAGAFAAEPAKMMDSPSGKMLVTPKGMTLYTFDKDMGGKSSCDAQCLKMWPAFHAEKASKADTDFSVVKAMDGKDMWAYKGMPLYRYHEDMKKGDAKGDGKGGVWHVVK
jgi:predicted lipoprotein with Yx(FWY)xxD motif